LIEAELARPRIELCAERLEVVGGESRGHAGAAAGGRPV
jgi:hypothetical protein